MLLSGCLVTPDASLWQDRDSSTRDSPSVEASRDLPAADRDDLGAADLGDQGVPDSGGLLCTWSGAVTLGAPVAVTELNSASTDIEPYVSADGLTIFFASNRGSTWDSYVATRPDLSSPFANVAVNQQVSTDTDNETRFALTPDGLEGFLATDQPGGEGGADIWRATRSSATTPFALADFQPVAALNSAGNEWDPYPSGDGLRLYYVIQNWAGGLGGSDVVVATRTSLQDPFGTPAGVAGINSADKEDNPAVTGDGRVIVFGSDRSGGQGGTDLWYAVRADSSASFSTPQPVPGVNSADNDTEVFISADGCTLYFTSDRSGGQGGQDIYRATVQSP